MGRRSESRVAWWGADILKFVPEVESEPLNLSYIADLIRKEFIVRGTTVKKNPDGSVDMNVPVRMDGRKGDTIEVHLEIQPGDLALEVELFGSAGHQKLRPFSNWDDKAQLDRFVKSVASEMRAFFGKALRLASASRVATRHLRRLG